MANNTDNPSGVFGQEPEIVHPHFHGELKSPENLPEQFMLFALNSKGKFHVDTRTVYLGLAGAVLVDLARREQITVTQDLVIPTPVEGSTMEVPLQQVMHILDRAPENKDAEHWLNRLARQALSEAIARRLVDKDLVEKRSKRFFGLVNIDRYYPIDMHISIDYITNLRAALNQDKPLDLTTWPLLSLLNMTGILPKIFRQYDQEKVTDAICDWREMEDSRRTQSVFETLQATENTIAEALTASRGGPSGMTTSTKRKK